MGNFCVNKAGNFPRPNFLSFPLLGPNVSGGLRSMELAIYHFIADTLSEKVNDKMKLGVKVEPCICFRVLISS